jgi:hypothetical protein
MVFVVVGNDFDESLLHYAGTPGLHVFVDSAGRLVLRRLDYEARTLRGLVRSSAFGRYLAWNLHAHTQVLDLWHRLRHGSRVEAPVVGNTASQADSVRVLDSHRAIDAVLDRLPAATGLPANRMLFLLDGRRPDLYSDSAMTASSGSYFAIMRQYFQRAAEERGYEVRDLEPRFAARYKAAGTRFEFKTDGHWNSAGHAEAAATAA